MKKLFGLAAIILITYEVLKHFVKPATRTAKPKSVPREPVHTLEDEQ